MSEIDLYDDGEQTALAERFQPYKLTEERVSYRDLLSRYNEPLTLPLPPYHEHGRARINFGKRYLVDAMYARYQIEDAREKLHACFTSEGRRTPGQIAHKNGSVSLRLTARTRMPAGSGTLSAALVGLQGESPAEWTARHTTEAFYPQLVEPYTFAQDLRTPSQWARGQLRHVLGFAFAMHLSQDFPIVHASHPYMQAASVVCNQPSEDMRREWQYEVSDAERAFTKYGPDALHVLLELRDLIPLDRIDENTLAMLAEMPRAITGGLIVTTIPPLVRSLVRAGSDPAGALSWAVRTSLDVHSKGEEPWWFYEGQDLLPVLFLLGKQRGFDSPEAVLRDPETRTFFSKIANLTGHATAECATLYALSGHRLAAFPWIDEDAVIRFCDAVVRNYGIGNLARAGRIIDMMVSWLQETDEPECRALFDACVDHLDAHKPLNPVVASLEGDDAGFPLPGMQLFYGALHPDDERTKTIDSLNYVPEDFHRLLQTIGSEGKTKNAALRMMALYRRFADHYKHEAYEMTCIYFQYCAKYMPDPWNPPDQLLDVMQILEYIPVRDDPSDEYREGHQSSHRHFETLGMLLSLQKRGALSDDRMAGALAWMTHGESILGDEPEYETELLSLRLHLLHGHRSVFQSLTMLADAGILDGSVLAAVSERALGRIVSEHVGSQDPSLTEFHHQFAERLPKAGASFSSLLATGVLDCEAVRRGFDGVREPAEAAKMVHSLFGVLDRVETHVEYIRHLYLPDVAGFDARMEELLPKIDADLASSSIVDRAGAAGFFRAAAANIRRENDVRATLSELFERTRRQLSLAGIPEALGNATATSLHLGGILSGAHDLRAMLPPHRNGIAELARPSDAMLMKRGDEHFLTAYDRSQGDIHSAIRTSRMASRGLVPVGGKVHVHAPLSPEVVTLLERAFNFPGKTSFRLIHANDSLLLPPSPSPGELTLALAALGRMGIFNDNFAELQIALAGRLDPVRCPILATTILLTSMRNPQFDCQSFETTHQTGRRFLAYDAQTPPVPLPWMPKTGGRTDILGRMDVRDIEPGQLVHTVLMQEQDDDGPFGNLAHDFRGEHAALLRDAGLSSVLTVSWVRDPGIADRDEERVQREHFEAVQACATAYSECAVNAVKTGEAKGIVFAMRELVADLRRKVDRLQEEHYPATHPEVAQLLTL